MKDFAKAPDNDRDHEPTGRRADVDLSRRPLSPMVARRLQTSAGNRALSAMIAQRRTTTTLT